MDNVEKIVGGLHIHVTEDEKLLAILGDSSYVCVYDLETKEMIRKIKTLENSSYAVISPDKTRIAVKNTSGTIAILSMETGGMLSANEMGSCEGYEMVFTSDGKYILDFDWDGKSMSLDVESNTYSILDDQYERAKRNDMPRVAFHHFDKYSDRIYRFLTDDFGNSSGIIEFSPADPENLRFEKIQEFPVKLPNQTKGISFCSRRNFYVDEDNQQIVATDKDFHELERIDLPEILKQPYYFPKKTFISPDEQYVLFDIRRPCEMRVGKISPATFMQTYRNTKPVCYLYRLDTMEMIWEANLDYVWDFTMLDNDSTYVVSLARETYIGKV